MIWIFLTGLFSGAWIGFFIGGLLRASRRGEERMRDAVPGTDPEAERKARIARREQLNFLTYNGEPQEDPDRVIE